MRLLSLLAVVILWTSCTDTDSPAAIAPDDAALRAHARQAEEVPIHWSYTVMPMGSDMVQCTTPEGDPTPVEFNEYWAFEGYLSYVERLDASESWAQFEECFVTVDEYGNPATFSAPTLVHLEGIEGDVLQMEGVIDYDVMTWIGVAEWTITGGAGKFAGAEGSIISREYAGFTIQGGTTYGIGTGTITRPTEIESRPMKLDFTFEPDLSQGTCDVVVPGFGVVAQLPAVSHGTGQASHMGRSSTTITHEWCRLDPARGIVGGGSFETIGANGAAVTGIWDGYVDEDGSIALTGWINDGTGRFTASWGELAIRGFSDPAEGGWFEADGRIVY